MMECPEGCGTVLTYQEIKFHLESRMISGVRMEPECPMVYRECSDCNLNYRPIDDHSCVLSLKTKLDLAEEENSTLLKIMSKKQEKSARVVSDLES